MNQKAKVVCSVVSLALSVILIVIGGLVYTVKSRIPSVTGDLRAAGLSGQVFITTDRFGIPHIEAAGKDDLYFALGFVHARDRLFQMEFLKRIAQG
ncbi:MAG TPA: penicillin acylase family protein, partial [Spirochaetes bacterium]|nr:penicillin acylase family protein [Spirochaetota bacterium]